MYNIIRYERKKNSKLELLRENCYNLITNLLTEETTRNTFTKGGYFSLLESIVERLSEFNPKVIDKKTQFAAACLGIFQNLSFNNGHADKLKELYTDLNIGDVITNRFLNLDYKNERYALVIERTLSILSKLDLS